MVTNAHDLKDNEAYDNMQTSNFAFALILCHISGFKNLKVVMCICTPGRRQSKTLILSTDIDKKSLETEFSIAICRPTVSSDF